LAGLSYKVEFPDDEYRRTDPDQKSYRIDIWGFLLDPDEWDERFSVLKAYEMKIPEGLSGSHWEILRFLRQEFFRTGRIPTVYDTCEAVGIDLEEFERLFPDGYHRGAVKIAGLRVLSGLLSLGA
jgi:tRNA 2-thiouridine synthesizing protein E